VTADARLERWLAAVLATPGLTAAESSIDARRALLDDSLQVADLVQDGPVVDVGSGGGSPGIPIAAARPELRVDLLEARRRKCAFLETAAAEFPNAEVVCARAEDYGRAAGREAYGTAVAQALAQPPVALEWCLPLVRAGGQVILLAGEVDLDAVALAAAAVGGGTPRVIPAPGSARRAFVLVPKIARTPDGFPRRTGIARKRPLA
jgi:16S rRNA (guanine527-N7)-methyltransferase